MKSPQHESWLQRLLARTGWVGGVLAVLEIELRMASCRLSAFRKKILITLCAVTIGLILIGISLIALAAIWVVAWWQDYPLQSLAALSLVYAGVGLAMIGRVIR